jgi:hypothetical protein
MLCATPVPYLCHKLIVSIVDFFVEIVRKNKFKRALKIELLKRLVKAMQGAACGFSKPPEYPVQMFLWCPGSSHRDPRLKIHAEARGFALWYVILVWCGRKADTECTDFRPELWLAMKQQAERFAICDADQIPGRYAIIFTDHNQYLGIAVATVVPSRLKDGEFPALDKSVPGRLGFR